MDNVYFVLIDWEDTYKPTFIQVHPESKNGEIIVGLEPSYNGL